jgi:F0F1-type ATP synthase membrane subunit a
MNLYSFMEGQVQVPPVIQATALVVFLLLTAGVIVRSRLAAAGGGAVPDEGFSLRNAVEILVEALADQGRSIIGENYRSYFPLVGAIFFFILIGNVTGLIPGLGEPTTGNVNTAAAWALISFGAYNYVGIRQHGWK